MEGYRKTAAETLKNLPKEERNEKLAEMQKTDEYWKARTEKLLSSGQKAEFTDDRTSLHWNTKSVYHGTNTPEIDKFEFAEESTIGSNAVYFTIDPTLAMGYAKLRQKERDGQQAYLYEAMLSDVSLMNWAEPKTVEKLSSEFGDYCSNALAELDSSDYKDFARKYGLTEQIQQSTASYALKKIINICDQKGSLHGGNVKTIAQGVMGLFFEKFVKDRGYDGVITIEGGDDPEFTSKAGVSVVIFNKDKITSHRAVDITPIQS